MIFKILIAAVLFLIFVAIMAVDLEIEKYRKYIQLRDAVTMDSKNLIKLQKLKKAFEKE